MLTCIAAVGVGSFCSPNISLIISEHFIFRPPLSSSLPYNLSRSTLPLLVLSSRRPICPLFSSCLSLWSLLFFFPSHLISLSLTSSSCSLALPFSPFILSKSIFFTQEIRDAISSKWPQCLRGKFSPQSRAACSRQPWHVGVMGITFCCLFDSLLF